MLLLGVERRSRSTSKCFNRPPPDSFGADFFASMTYVSGVILEQPAWNSSAARYVYDAVEFFVSTWEKGTRYEERLTGRDELEAVGFLRDPVIGKVRVGHHHL